MNAESLTEQSNRLRADGDYEQAVEVAMRATVLAPDNANTWWALAQATERHRGIAEAYDALVKVVRLASKFAPGWFKLALAEKALGDAEEALASLKMAVDHDCNFEAALHELASTAKDASLDDDELWALQQLQDRDALRPFEWHRLGVLYSQRNEHALALVAHREYARREESAAAWFNLGLSYRQPEISQDADAIDCWREGLSRFPAHSSFSGSIATLLPRLVSLAMDVRASKHVLLPQESWYQHYISPVELLALEDSDLDDFDVKEGQRARRALLQEIELEEGRISWMPGLTLDKSRALTLSDELIGSPVQRDRHRVVYADKQLLSFLTKGSLEHFLVDASSRERPAAERVRDDPDYLAWLSPIFARQYDHVLSAALGRQDLKAVECLLDGRRWVAPGDEELCFSSARKHLSSAIDSLAAELERLQKLSRPAEASEVRRLLDGSRLGPLLCLMPHGFNDLVERVYECIRSLTYVMYREHEAAEPALEVLELTRPLVQKSKALLARLDDDCGQLKRLLQRERDAEWRARQGNEPMGVTRQRVWRADVSIPVDEVTGVRFGVTRVGDKKHYLASFTDGGRRTVRISWTGEGDETTPMFEQLRANLLNWYAPKCHERLVASIERGERVPVGSCTVTSQGVEVRRKGWFRYYQHLIPWDRLDTSLEAGVVHLQDKRDRNARAEMPMTQVDNAIVLHTLIKSKEKAA